MVSSRGDFDFSDYNNNKEALFYDLIYNPKETNFLKEARIRENKTMNGKMMFLWQAHLAFKKWTGVSPKIDQEVIKLLDKLEESYKIPLQSSNYR